MAAITFTAEELRAYTALCDFVDNITRGGHAEPTGGGLWTERTLAIEVLFSTEEAGREEGGAGEGDEVMGVLEGSGEGQRQAMGGFEIVREFRKLLRDLPVGTIVDLQFENLRNYMEAHELLSTTQVVAWTQEYHVETRGQDLIVSSNRAIAAMNGVSGSAKKIQELTQRYAETGIQSVVAELDDEEREFGDLLVKYQKELKDHIAIAEELLDLVKADDPRSGRLPQAATAQHDWIMM